MYRFNVRVYGIWINEQQQVLVCNEQYNGFRLCKFPGGGLEFGEGTLECLQREWREELSIEIDILQHFYTTDYFQVSAFDQQSQIISIYYLVQPQDVVKAQQVIQFKNFPTDSEAIIDCQQIPILQLSRDHLTMPIDQRVAMMLKETAL